MSTGYTDWDLTLPCGLRLSVKQLDNNGAGELHAHAFEFTWCVENPARIFGRSYDPDKKVAIGKAVECAKGVLVESRTMLEHIEL